MKTRRVETSDYLAALRRMIVAAGVRVGRADPEDLTELVRLHSAIDEATVSAIRGLRSDGYTWESIGAALGVTRQAALMRWGSR